MITIKKVNDEIIIPRKVKNIHDPKRIVGYQLFPDVYSNILITAKKNSGKTNVVMKILDRCVGDNTEIIAFVGTLNKDQIWLDAQKRWGEQFTGYTSIIDDETGEDRIKNLVEDLKAQAEEEEAALKLALQKKALEKKLSRNEKYKIPEHLVMLAKKEFKQMNIIEPEEEEKDKMIAPEFIIIFDDISNELHNKHLLKLVKEGRHYHCKIIISSQYLLDTKPALIKQIDYFLIFAKIGDDKLHRIYDNSDLIIDFDTLIALYHNATESVPFGFLYIDPSGKQTYRRKFNEQYTIKSGFGKQLSTR